MDLFTRNNGSFLYLTIALLLLTHIIIGFRFFEENVKVLWNAEFGFSNSEMEDLFEDYNYGYNNMEKPTFKCESILFLNDVSFAKKFENKTYKTTGVDPSLIVVENKYDITRTSMSSFRSIREYSIFYHFEETFVLPSGLIRLPNGFFWMMYRDYWPHPSECYDVKRWVNDAVYCCIKWSNCYGHILNDIICSCVMMPEWVWARHPVIITNDFREPLRFYLKAIGLGHLRTITKEKESFVYCKNLYVCKGFEDDNAFGVAAMPRVRDKFTKYFNLENIKPTKYHFINKARGERRFLNMVEIVEELNKKYNTDFTQFYDNFTDVASQAKIFAETKFMIMSGGSLVFNVVFSKPRTCYLIFMADYFDGPNYNLLYWLDIWAVGVLHMNASPDNPTPSVSYNKELIFQGYEVLKYVLENQKFPPRPKNFYKSFDVEDLLQKAKRDGDDSYHSFYDLFVKD